MKYVQAMAPPLSFAAGVILIVAGVLATPPLRGALYLMALVVGFGAYYYYVLGEGCQQEEEKVPPIRPSGKRAWYQAVELLQKPQHTDADL